VLVADPDAFIALYERDAEAVLVFLARRTLDVEVALDLTAETFAQAWRGWSGVRTDSREEVRGWLFTIARRQLGHFLRRGRVGRRAMQRLGLDVPDLHEDDLVEIERAAGISALRSTLAVELSTQQQSARRAAAADRAGAPV
jgi:RNA polymerase sigma-70 factor (ECF subfamily)